MSEKSSMSDAVARRRLSKRNVKRLGVAILAALAVIGVVQGIMWSMGPQGPAPNPMRSMFMYHTELPGEPGFREFYRQRHENVDKAVPAGYAVCSDIEILGMNGTYSEISSATNVQRKADDLLYASVHYLCPKYEQSYNDWKAGK